MAGRNVETVAVTRPCVRCGKDCTRVVAQAFRKYTESRQTFGVCACRACTRKENNAKSRQRTLQRSDAEALRNSRRSFRAMSLGMRYIERADKSSDPVQHRGCISCGAKPFGFFRSRVKSIAFCEIHKDVARTLFNRHMGI